MGERPTLTLSFPEQKRFYVTITKTQEKGTLDGERMVITANHVGDQVEGRYTGTGWELTYTSSGTRVHEIHLDVAAQHFNCIYSEDSTPDLAAAEAICRSLRPRY